MPEGHSVHRIARQFQRNFVGHAVSASSPQGRFSEGASLLDGGCVVDVSAVGKQMFMEFDSGLWLRVHLGMYGAWDFAGQIVTDATIDASNGRMGQTNHRGTDISSRVFDDAGENSLSSIGAPRKARVRMSEQTKADTDVDWESFPPPPVGAVRLRLLTESTVADLRGPTACEVIDAERVAMVTAKLGPDAARDSGPDAEEKFIGVIRRKPTAIGLLLMDQSVVSGIGNVYRAELLFRARIDPHTPGKNLARDVLSDLWRDWAGLLMIGIATGQMMTMDNLGADDYARAMAHRSDRHWVYKREGLPCRVCGTHIVLEEMGARKLYWCPSCQRT